MARTTLIVATAVLSAAALSSRSYGQCQLANPSFEFAGDGGAPFAGWNTFGTVWAASDPVPHGYRSAGVSAPFAGTWAVSGLWQRLDTAPGTRWLAALRVGHRANQPLTGDTCAILNVEWRDANDALLSYESHVVADASTPTETMQRVTLQTAPAPAGTVATHLLFGVLQSPAQHPGTAYFDLIEFHSLGPPTLEERQWFDFPGGRTLSFGGRSWRAKGPLYTGPGPDWFADGAEHIWVDARDRLHMTIRNVGGVWYSTEITAEETLGYGDYVFTTRGRLDTWAENVVLGLFIWQYPVCWTPANLWNLHNEIDVELSRWGTPGDDLAQFVVQPWEYPANLSRFGITFDDNDLVSYAFRWLPDRVECRCWRGGLEAEAPETLIHTWTYVGPHLPRPEQPRVHLNFWQYDGPPSNGRDHEVIIEQFAFIPSCADAESDFPCLAACLDGPGGGLPSSCGVFDLDLDGDVDLRDFAAWQQAVVR
jgi:hypothetical protein